MASETDQAAGTVPVEIKHRWSGAVLPKRRGSPRAVRPVCRARIAHTSRGGRRIDLFLTAPLYHAAGFRIGGTLAADFALGGNHLALRLRPAHDGVRLHPYSPTSSTGRVCITADAIAPSICAPSREVSALVEDGALLIVLPREWAAVALAEAMFAAPAEAAIAAATGSARS